MDTGDLGSLYDIVFKKAKIDLESRQNNFILVPMCSDVILETAAKNVRQTGFFLPSFYADFCLAHIVLCFLSW